MRNMNGRTSSAETTNKTVATSGPNRRSIVAFKQGPVVRSDNTEMTSGIGAQTSRMDMQTPHTSMRLHRSSTSHVHRTESASSLAFSYNLRPSPHQRRRIAASLTGAEFRLRLGRESARRNLYRSARALSTQAKPKL